MNSKTYIWWDKNSIAFKFMILIIILVIAQSTLLISTMIVAGVLKEAEDSAFYSFNEKVGNQKNELQKEMSNRWTNIDPFLQEISWKIPVEKNTEHSTEQFLQETMPTLISMLRTTMTTGAFIIFNNHLTNPNDRIALYLRDYDPLLNDDKNKDLYTVAGPSELSQRFKIPLDTNWSYHLKLTKENKTFYEKPYSKANLSTNSKLLGYWSKPFQLTTNDLPMITYSMPIFDRNNQLRGIIGVEILVDYFNQYLPGKDLLARDSLGYLIGFKNEQEKQIYPLITNGAIQNRILNTQEPFVFTNKDKNHNIYLLENHNNTNNIYAGVQKINLYYSNTPFEHEEWYLIGLTDESKLLSLVNKIQSILIISFIGSILLGVVGGYWISRVYTKPIISLAKQVHASSLEKGTSFARTGITEIDDLSHAIEVTNTNLLESTSKLSRIIHLVNISLGAFEYKQHEENVFMTEQLKTLLLFGNTEMTHFYTHKENFIQRLNTIMEHKEPDEDDIYKISDAPAKWVRINMIVDESSTLGIVIDVTEEIQEKRQIKLDRDYDALTKIYNRGAFKRAVVKLLEQNNFNCSACIMFDLDFLKDVNDTHGHKWGDIYIATTADYLSTFKQKGNVIGRLSGDEFAVFLYGFENKEQIRQLVELFYKKIVQNPISFPDGERQIMISGGLFWLDNPNEAYQYDSIMHNADEALYKAKKTIKGTLQEFN